MKTCEQLELFPETIVEPGPGPRLDRIAPAPPPADLQARLQHRLGEALEGLTLTNNRSTFLSAQWNPDRTRLKLRIQRCFEQAPDDVLDAVAIFVTSRRRSSKSRLALELLRLWFDRHLPPPGQGSAGRRRLRPVGAVHDLKAISDRLNREFFRGELSVAITWGRARRRRNGRRRRRWTLQLGSYCGEENLIRVHRVLDQAHVPPHVVEAVVHHELVHAALPAAANGGRRRRRVHGPDFERLERLYPHLEEAARWLDRHMRRLLDES
jgi:hypothetical protein